MKRNWKKIRRKYKKGIRHVRKVTKSLKPRGQTKKKRQRAYGFKPLPPRKKLSKKLF